MLLPATVPVQLCYTLVLFFVPVFFPPDVILSVLLFVGIILHCRLVGVGGGACLVVVVVVVVVCGNGDGGFVCCRVLSCVHSIRCCRTM